MRLRFRFGLRAWLLASAIAAAVLAWGGRHVQQVHRQRVALAFVKKLGGTYTYTRPATAFGRRIPEDRSAWIGPDH